MPTLELPNSTWYVSQTEGVESVISWQISALHSQQQQQFIQISASLKIVIWNHAYFSPRDRVISHAISNSYTTYIYNMVWAIILVWYTTRARVEFKYLIYVRNF